MAGGEKRRRLRGEVRPAAEKPAAFPFPDLGGGCPGVAFQLFSNLG